MRCSQLFFFTTKDTPSDAQVVSHRLMLRAGLIHQTVSGIYIFSPLAQRVLSKIERIIEEEQNQIGAQRIIMPTVQPAHLWIESGRYDDYGKEMLRIKDRHERDLLYGPTHEEVVVDFFRSFVKSYRHLPLTLYQIHWKFRDEIRPRFGLMRGREFLMKDAYSFHMTEACLEKTYHQQYMAYITTFKRMGLKAVAVSADAGPIGGSLSHEFHVLAQTGESSIYYDAAYDDLETSELSLDDLKGIYAVSDDKYDPKTCSIPRERLKQSRGIEVGHIFAFGQKYTKAMNTAVTDDNGNLIYPYMGSYGIGVSRLLGAIIEANHDEKGIIWPIEVAPFEIVIINLKEKDEFARELCEEIYQELDSFGIDVLYDDRDERAGVKFADMDLIGIPYQIIIGKESKSYESLEVKTRATGEKCMMSLQEIIQMLVGLGNDDFEFE